MSLELLSITGPLPSTQANFSTKLSYHAKTQLLGYYNHKSCYLMKLCESESENESDNDTQAAQTVLQFGGHGASPVSSISFSPVGQYVASGDESGRVLIWEFFTKPKEDLSDSSSSYSVEYDYKIKSEFQVLSGKVRDISWDFEGKRLCVVGSGSQEYGRFITWDSGNSVGEVSGHSSTVNGCCINPNGRPFRCFTCDDEGSIVFYQGVPFKFKSSDREHHDRGKFVRACEYNTDGTKMCSVGSDRKINIYDGKTGEFIKTLTNSDHVKSGFYGCCFLNANRLIVVGSTIEFYENEELVSSFSPKDSSSLSPRDSILYVGVTKISSNSFVAVQNNGVLQKFTIPSNGNEITNEFTINGHSKSISCISSSSTTTTSSNTSSSSSSSIYTGSIDNRIIKWDLETLDDPTKCVVYDKVHSNNVISVSFNESNTSLTSVSWDETCKTTTFPLSPCGSESLKQQQQQQHQYNFPGGNQPKISITYNNDSLLVVDHNNNIYLKRDISSDMECITELLYSTNSTNKGKEITCAAMTGEYIVFGYDSTNEIEVFRVSPASDNNSFPLQVEESYILCKLLNKPSHLSISASISASTSSESTSSESTTKYLTCGDNMGKMVLYDLNTRELKTSRWSFHTGKITCSSWIPGELSSLSSSHVATGSLDTHLMIYSVERPMKVIKKLNTHVDGVSTVLWLNRETILSTGHDGCVKKWRVVF